jgi:hypothetical protein
MPTGKLIRQENMMWYIKEINREDAIAIPVDMTQDFTIPEEAEGIELEFDVKTIAVGRDEFTVTELDVAVIRK